MGEAILRLKEACWMVGEEYMPYAIAAHKSLSAFE